MRALPAEHNWLAVHRDCGDSLYPKHLTLAQHRANFIIRSGQIKILELHINMFQGLQAAAETRS